jgi:hypothetical protein
MVAPKKGIKGLHKNSTFIFLQKLCTTTVDSSVTIFIGVEEKSVAQSIKTCSVNQQSSEAEKQ